MRYVIGNLAPWREPAWALLHERASILVGRCAAVGQAEGCPVAVREAGANAAAIIETVAAHVPVQLRAGTPAAE